VPEAPVTANIHKALDVQTDFGSESAFNLEFRVNQRSNLLELVLAEIVHHPHGVNLGPFADTICRRTADSIDVGQCNIDVFVREVDSRNSSHSIPPSALALLVLGIDANDPDDTSSFDNLAFIAYGLYARSNLHDKPSEKTVYYTVISKIFLQVPRPDLSFFHQTFVMMHLQLRFNLAHGIKIDTDKDQKRSSSHQR